MKTYSKNEIESISSEILSHLHQKYPEIDVLDLAALLLYASSFIIYTSTDASSDPTVKPILVGAGSFAYSWLTVEPTPESSNPPTQVDDATLPQQQESSEV